MHIGLQLMSYLFHLTSTSLVTSGSYIVIVNYI